MEYREEQTDDLWNWRHKELTISVTKQVSYRIGGNFQGMKFSQISRVILASWTYNREHFMHNQLKLIVLLIVVFGIGSEMSDIFRFSKLLKESDLNPKSRELASNKVKKYVVSISLFSYTS